MAKVLVIRSLVKIKILPAPGGESAYERYAINKIVLHNASHMLSFQNSNSLRNNTHGGLGTLALGSAVRIWAMYALRKSSEAVKLAGGNR